MSYDLYCYKSQSGIPNMEEAKEIIDVKEADNNILADPHTKLSIASRLVKYNPRLEGVDFDFDELAALNGISVEKAKEIYSHIELRTSEKELETFITIFDSIVVISVPYLYTGKEAEQTFKNINIYTKLIRQVAGYFVYDPQTGFAYDPSLADFSSLQVYLRISQKHKTL